MNLFIRSAFLTSNVFPRLLTLHVVCRNYIFSKNLINSQLHISSIRDIIYLDICFFTKRFYNKQEASGCKQKTAKNSHRGFLFSFLMGYFVAAPMQYYSEEPEIGPVELRMISVGWQVTSSFGAAE